MQTMDASLAGLVRENRITMSMAESRSSEPTEMRKLVHSAPQHSTVDGMVPPPPLPPSTSPPMGVGA
jgi:hypothetical protein